MLSRNELERAARLLDAGLRGGHLDRIVQRDGVTLELELSEPPRERKGRTHRQLVMSCDPRYARLGEVAGFGPAPPAPLGFAQLLRARVSRARILAVVVEPGERQLTLRLAAAEGVHQLVLQLLGPRSNIYLLDAAGTLLGSLRPLALTRRELAVGADLAPPASAPPPGAGDRFAGVDDAGFLAAIESHYAALERAQAAELLARRLSRAFERERQRLVRREGALGRDLARLRPASEQRRLGELLKGALHAVRPGTNEITVRDLATGQDVTIPLEPALSPAQNLAKYFAGYQRARRREQATAEQGAALEAELATLTALREAFEALAGSDLPEPEALSRFSARAEVARLLARHRLPGEGRSPQPPRAPRRGEAPARLRPGRYRTSDGLEVWVGRSAEGNDHLTTRLARGNDLFLHVEASPGSHVVVRLAGRKDAPQESLLEASELAVHFSKQRDADRATLHVAPIKDVRKPSGAKPGLVQVLRGRRFVLRRDPARLARVLASRVEDPD